MAIGMKGIAVRFRSADAVEKSFAEIAGGEAGDQTELILPADAIRLELIQEIEHGETHAKLLFGRLFREVRSVGLAPMELDAILYNEMKRGVDPILFDLLALRDQPSWSTLCSANPCLASSGKVRTCGTISHKKVRILKFFRKLGLRVLAVGVRRNFGEFSSETAPFDAFCIEALYIGAA